MKNTLTMIVFVTLALVLSACGTDGEGLCGGVALSGPCVQQDAGNGSNDGTGHIDGQGGTDGGVTADAAGDTGSNTPDAKPFTCDQCKSGETCIAAESRCEVVEGKGTLKVTTSKDSSDSSDPKADVYIDGKLVGTSPTTADLSPGPHTVEVKMERRFTWFKGDKKLNLPHTIIVVAGKTVELDVELYVDVTGYWKDDSGTVHKFTPKPGELPNEYCPDGQPWISGPAGGGYCFDKGDKISFCPQEKGGCQESAEGFFNKEGTYLTVKYYYYPEKSKSKGTYKFNGK